MTVLAWPKFYLGHAGKASEGTSATTHSWDETFKGHGENLVGGHHVEVTSQAFKVFAATAGSKLGRSSIDCCESFDHRRRFFLLTSHHGGRSCTPSSRRSPGSIWRYILCCFWRIWFSFAPCALYSVCAISTSSVFAILVFSDYCRTCLHSWEDRHHERRHLISEFF